jgi:hypothetical protein
MMREYILYRDGCHRAGFVPDPPSIWRQHMPPVEVNVDAERNLYQGEPAGFDAWLAAKYPALTAEFKAELQAQKRRVFSTFEQWLDYRYAVKCAELRAIQRTT